MPVPQEQIDESNRRRARSRRVAQERRVSEAYGLTLDAYEAMLAEAEVCPICLRRFSGTVRKALDHDHQTGRVRGVLCSTCNGGMGVLGDDVDRLQRAIDWLSR